MAKRRSHRQTSGNDDSDGKELIQLGSPFFECTKLPKHYRAQKALTFSFQLRLRPGYERSVPDGTLVEIRAGNEENHCGELKNNTTRMKDGVATFNDFRLIGKSGRGKTFILSFIIFTDPILVVSYPDAIKVTVDGPRDPRNPKHAKLEESPPLPSIFRSRPFFNYDDDENPVVAGPATSSGAIEFDQSPSTRNLIDRSLPTQVVPSSLVVPPHRPSPQLPPQPLPQHHVQQLPPPQLQRTAAHAATYFNAAALAANSMPMFRDPFFALANLLLASRHFGNMTYMSPAAAAAASYQLQATLAEAAVANGIRPPLAAAVAAATGHSPLDFSTKNINNHVLVNDNIRNSINNNNCSSTNGLMKISDDSSSMTTNENVSDENGNTDSTGKRQKARSSSHFNVDDLLYECSKKNTQVNSAHTSHSR